MNQIKITRDSNGNVVFETVSIDVTENVFFTNLDPEQPHWPYVEICTNQVGPAPSPNSSQCTVFEGVPPMQVNYKCRIDGHENEQGTINVFAQLAAANQTLPPAAVNQPLPKPVQVVTGGKSPYTVSGEQFQITGGNPSSGSGIGPGLTLQLSTNNQGIAVSGTPTVAGTYNFTFVVEDAMGKNLQQIQYSMKVA
jgi:hypothetical protein